mmetsp:Transcript_14267/g.45843  ORF Transcript_14267/g.45843 Transcript_14267/m.45843 type:complete len:271 (+) Transcript_14267:104-916(+)
MPVAHASHAGAGAASVSHRSAAAARAPLHHGGRQDQSQCPASARRAACRRRLCDGLPLAGARRADGPAACTRVPRAARRGQGLHRARALHVQARDRRRRRRRRAALHQRRAHVCVRRLTRGVHLPPRGALPPLHSSRPVGAAALHRRRLCTRAVARRDVARRPVYGRAVARLCARHARHERSAATRRLQHRADAARDGARALAAGEEVRGRFPRRLASHGLGLCRLVSPRRAAAGGSALRRQRHGQRALHQALQRPPLQRGGAHQCQRGL